jgi:hypothetical protein
MLGDKKSPDVICESLGFTRTFGAGRVIPREQCTSNVDLIRREYAKLPPESKSDLNARLPIDKVNRLSSNEDDLERKQHIRGQALPDEKTGHLPLDHEGPRRFDRARFPLAMRGNAICKDLGPDERLVCEIISRLVLRGMADDLEAGLSSVDICKKLEDRRLIKLTDAAP